MTTKHRRHNPGMVQSQVTDADNVRFDKLREVGTEDACWPFKGYTTPSGYGRFRFVGEKRGAHVFAYLRDIGDIAPYAEIDHICHNRCCVNPAHLEQVSKTENLARRRY